MDTRLIHSYLYNLGIQGASALIKPQTFSLIVQKKNLNQRFYHTNYKLKTNIMWACFVILIIDHIGDIIMLHCMHMSFPFRCYLYPSLFIQAHCDVTLCHHSVWHTYLLPVRGRRYMCHTQYREESNGIMYKDRNCMEGHSTIMYTKGATWWQ